MFKCSGPDVIETPGSKACTPERSGNLRRAGEEKSAVEEAVYAVYICVGGLYIVCSNNL